MLSIDHGGAGKNGGTGKEIDAIGNAISDKEIGNGRYRKIDNDFNQGVDLVLFAHGANFKEGETGMHRKHHNGAHQDEKHVRGSLESLHKASPRLLKSVSSRSVLAGAVGLWFGLP